MKYRLLACLILGLFLPVTCDGPRPPLYEPTITLQESAWYACAKFIEERLGPAVPDMQIYDPDGVKTISEDQFEVTIYHVRRGKAYQCDLQRSDGKWELQHLKAK